MQALPFPFHTVPITMWAEIFLRTLSQRHILCLLFVSHYPTEGCLLFTVSECEFLLPVAWDVYEDTLVLSQELCVFHNWVPLEDHSSPNVPEWLLINEWDNFGFLVVLSRSLQISSKAYIWNKASWISTVTEEQIFSVKFFKASAKTFL